MNAVKEVIMADEIKDALVEDDDIITLMGEDGAEEEFYHIATIDYDDKWYIFLHPVEEQEGIAEDEALIFEIGEDEEGNDLFNLVEDDELIDKVYAEYIKELDKIDPQ